jgi:hypothetical protein
MKVHVALAATLAAALWGCGSSSEYEPEDKVIVVPSTATMQPPYNADGGQPTRRYVVRMSDGSRDWEVEFPETASGYQLKIPMRKSDPDVIGGGKPLTAADKEIEANMRRNNPDVPRDGAYVDGKNVTDPKGDQPGSELGKPDGGSGRTGGVDPYAGTEANPDITRRSYLRAIEDVKRLYRAGRYEAALIELKKLDEEYPDDVKVMSMLGTLYLKNSQEDLARQYWEEVLQIEPGNREVMEALKQLNARRSSPQPRAAEPARPADGAPKPPERIEEPPPTPIEKVP